MRILSVNVHLPEPERGGGWTLAYEHLQWLADRHEITLITGGLPPGASTPALDAIGVDVVGVLWQPRRNPGGPRLLLEAVRGPGSRRFRSVTTAVEALGAAVAAAERQTPFDVVAVMPGEVAPVVDAARAPTALFLPDCYASQARRARRTGVWKDRLLAAIELGHVRRWEARQYTRASALAAVSHDDADVLRRLTGRPVDVVPLMIGDEWFEAPDRRRADGLVTIVAALDYGPNIDGVLWFLRRVWPKVRERDPEARLRVVGRQPPTELREAVEAAGGDLRADIADARHHYWESSVAVVPLRLGSGVKTKLLHAFACGAPVVATPVAVEGVAVTDGDDVVVRGSAAGLAEAIVDALRQPAAAAARAERARRVVEGYRRAVAGEAYERFLERTADSPLTLGNGITP